MCLFPTSARLPPEGGRPKIDPEGDLKLPCGKCSECISARALEWSLRCRHEISLHEENCFLTLTYDSKNLPSHFTVKEPFQNFMKSLRQHLKKKLSYIVSHEYGTKTYRPHHHAIIFGYNPPEQKFLKNTTGGNSIFTSPEITRFWDHGFHSIGCANEKTAYYIASYALKGKKKKITHPDTGEMVIISDTMDVSKRPAIGLNYLIKNQKQLVHSGEKLPRYYKKKLEIINPDLYMEYEQKQIHAPNRSEQERLAKLVITEQKQNQSESEFRKSSEKSDHKHYVKYLKDDINFNASK